MRAEILQQEQGYTAHFERSLSHNGEAVWNMLADNEKLAQWFDELRLGEAGKGRKMLFDMGDGEIEELTITDYEEGRVLAFEWWEDHVRFEVEAAEGGTVLRLVERIRRITPQTVKDLAGWHVCLDVIEALLNNQKVDRDTEWQHWHGEYKRLLDSMTVEFE